MVIETYFRIVGAVKKKICVIFNLQTILKSELITILIDLKNYKIYSLYQSQT